MSFILDALKKAESERNRRVAPVLMDARVAPPRRGLPAWAWVLGAVLLVNLGLLGWILWRAPAQQATGQLSLQPTSDGDGGQPADGSMTAAIPATPIAQASPATPTGTPPMEGAGAQRAPEPAAGNPPGAPALPGIAAAAPPAPDTRPPADIDALPTLYELRAAGVTLPELQLHLHVYDPAPAQRYVLLDAQRLREGEYTPNGVKVERITPTGVVLEASGRRFRLDTGG